MRLAKKNGVKVSFDPNIRPELLHGKIMDYYKEIIDRPATCSSPARAELKLLSRGPGRGQKELLPRRSGPGR